MVIVWLQPKDHLVFNSIVKRAARFVFGMDYFSPVSDRVARDLTLLFAKIAFEIQKFCNTTKSEQCPHAF